MYLQDIFTIPANLAGLPGLSIPCGEYNGLPLGMQLVGNSLEESKLLQFALLSIAYGVAQENAKCLG